MRIGRPSGPGHSVFSPRDSLSFGDCAVERRFSGEKHHRLTQVADVVLAGACPGLTALARM